jgi:peptidoglycan/LPS O-acetylase OafA/YrhL
MLSILGFGISLVTFLGMFLLAALLLKFPQYSFLHTREGRHVTIDGIRGLLAIAVFIHHFVVTWGWKTTGIWTRPEAIFFHNYGKVGVAIFFMITGFLFIEKLITSEMVDWKKLYKSRVCRIVPLYYFSVLLILLLVLHQSNYLLNVSYTQLIQETLLWLGSHGKLLNGFVDTRHINAGVDWTLKYEWLFYFTLPLLLLILKRIPKAGGAMLIVLCSLLFIYPYILYSIQSRFLILFAIGGIGAYLKKHSSTFTANLKSKLHSSISSCLLIASVFYPFTLTAGHLLIMAAFFMYIILGNDLFGLLSSKPSILLGEISYSIYLLHGIILFTAFTTLNLFDIKSLLLEQYLFLMPTIGGIVVLASAFSYKLIEQPFINVGKQTSARSKEPQNSQSINRTIS